MSSTVTGRRIFGLLAVLIVAGAGCAKGAASAPGGAGGSNRDAPATDTGGAGGGGGQDASGADLVAPPVDASGAESVADAPSPDGPAAEAPAADGAAPEAPAVDAPAADLGKTEAPSGVTEPAVDKAAEAPSASDAPPGSGCALPGTACPGGTGTCAVSCTDGFERKLYCKTGPMGPYWACSLSSCGAAGPPDGTPCDWPKSTTGTCGYCSGGKSVLCFCEDDGAGGRALSCFGAGSC